MLHYHPSPNRLPISRPISIAVACPLAGREAWYGGAGTVLAPPFIHAFNVWRVCVCVFVVCQKAGKAGRAGSKGGRTVLKLI